MVQRYRANKSARYTDEEAQLIGEGLEILASRKRGELKHVTTEEVVAAAEHERSVLHKFFDWDDGRAAHSFRLHQANTLVNHLRVIVEVGAEERETKAFHSVVVVLGAQEEQKTYMATEVVFRNPPLREQVVERALREAEAWAERHREYEELVEIIEVIDRVRRGNTVRSKA